jgi:cytochrome c5
MKKILLVIISASVFAAGCDNSEKAVNKPAPKAESVQSVAPPVMVETPVEATTAAETKTLAPPTAPTQPVTLSAEAIYNRSCVACHKTGAANAPKVGDAAAWAPRIAKGFDALLHSALNGVPGTAMMPKGTCSACSEDEIKSVVRYMMSQSK